MEKRTFKLTLLLLLIVGTAFGQKNRKNKDLERGYAFDGGSFVISAATGFFGHNYGYGKLGGAPFKLTTEVGVHRYVGIALYGGLLHRDPVWGENSYQMDIYTGGGHLNFHLYNLVDDLFKKNLRGDIIDVYITGTVGFDYFDTTLPLREKYAVYYTAGLGVRAYPIKKAPGLGFNMEFSNILSPWLLGINYRF